MKIKLDIGIKDCKAVKDELTAHGIEIDDNAEWILSENSKYIAKLIVRDTVSSTSVILPVEDIVLIETFRHTVEVHTQENTYHASDRLYKIFNLLDPEHFLRVSNSVVIAKDKVRQINPTLSMKFILTMVGGREVDVTRSYYYIFKEHFGI